MFVILGVHPSDVSTVLGLAPDRAWVAGERNNVQLSDGRTLELDSVSERSGWKKFPPDDIIEPVQVLNYWVEFVRTHALALQKMPEDTIVSVEILVQENQALEVTPEDLAILSAARVGLTVTIQVMGDGELAPLSRP